MSLALWNMWSWSVARSLSESRLSTLSKRFEFEEDVEVACGDGNGAAPAVNKSLKTNPGGAAPEDTAWVDGELVICAVDDVRVWFDQDDGDGDENGDGDGDEDEARLLNGRCASSRCRRLGFADGVGFPLIFTWQSNFNCVL